MLGYLPTTPSTHVLFGGRHADPRSTENPGQAIPAQTRKLYSLVTSCLPLLFAAVP